MKKGFGSPAGREKREDSKREREIEKREEGRGKREESREKSEERRETTEERRGKLTLVESKQNVCILEIEQK